MRTFFKGVAILSMMMYGQNNIVNATTCDDSLCNKCSKGEYKDAVSGDCFDCSDGTYQPNDASVAASCTDPGEGYKITDHRVKTLCSENYERSSVDPEQCVACSGSDTRAADSEDGCITVQAVAWKEAEDSGVTQAEIDDTKTVLTTAKDDPVAKPVVNISHLGLSAPNVELKKVKASKRALARQWKKDENDGGRSKPRPIKVAKEDAGLSEQAKAYIESKNITEIEIIPVIAKTDTTDCSQADVDLDDTGFFEVILLEVNDTSLKCNGNSPNSKLELTTIGDGNNADDYEASCYNRQTNQWGGVSTVSTGENYTCHGQTFFVSSDGGDPTVHGCTDPNANNFDSDADQDDGSCTFDCGCANGNGATDCTAVGQDKCASCNKGFGKVLDACNACVLGSTFQPNDDSTDACGAIASCAAGHGVTAIATTEVDTDCDACADGTTYSNLDSTTQQCLAVYTCQTSEYETSPPSTSANRECATKQCICELDGVSVGDGAEGDACSTHGENECATCGTGYGMTAVDSEICHECESPDFNTGNSDGPCAPGTCAIGKGYVWFNASVSNDCLSCTAATNHYSDSSEQGVCTFNDDTTKKILSNGEGEGTGIEDCPAGQVRDSTDPTKCEACDGNEYALNGVCTAHTVCDPAANKYETDFGSSTSNVVCGDFTTGVKYCSVVDGEGSCTAVSDVADDCVAGEYEKTDPGHSQNRECEPCDAGHFSTTTNADSCTAWLTCVGDEYETQAPSSTQNRGCTDRDTCSAGEKADQALGTYGDAQNRICSNCAAGDVQPNEGSTAHQCTPCAGDEEFQDEEGKAACKARQTCASGEKASKAVGNHAKTEDRSCSNCVAGTVQPAVGHGLTTCDDCDGDEEFQDEEGKAACKARQTCAAGEKASKAVGDYTQTEDRSCSDCLAGTVQPAVAHGLATCDACDDDEDFQDETGKATCKTRQKCAKGKKATLAVGAYADTDDRTCVDCEQHHFQDQPDYTGTTCTERSECGLGKGVTALSTPEEDTECGNCQQDSTYSDKSSATEACLDVLLCAAGKGVSVAPTLSSNTQCEDCPYPQYNTELGLSVCADKHCAAGYGFPNAAGHNGFNQSGYSSDSLPDCTPCGRLASGLQTFTANETTGQCATAADWQECKSSAVGDYDACITVGEMNECSTNVYGEDLNVCDANSNCTDISGNTGHVCDCKNDNFEVSFSVDGIVDHTQYTSVEKAQNDLRSCEYINVCEDEGNGRDTDRSTCDKRREDCAHVANSKDHTCPCKAGFEAASDPDAATVKHQHVAGADGFGLPSDRGLKGALCIKSDTEAATILYQGDGCCALSACALECKDKALDCGF